MKRFPLETEPNRLYGDTASNNPLVSLQSDPRFLQTMDSGFTSEETQKRTKIRHTALHAGSDVILNWGKCIEYTQTELRVYTNSDPHSPGGRRKCTVQSVTPHSSVPEHTTHAEARRSQGSS